MASERITITSNTGAREWMKARDIQPPNITFAEMTASGLVSAESDENPNVTTVYASVSEKVGDAVGTICAKMPISDDLVQKFHYLGVVTCPFTGEERLEDRHFCMLRVTGFTRKHETTYDKLVESGSAEDRERFMVNLFAQECGIFHIARAFRDETRFPGVYRTICKYVDMDKYPHVGKEPARVTIDDGSDSDDEEEDYENHSSNGKRPRFTGSAGKSIKQPRVAPQDEEEDEEEEEDETPLDFTAAMAMAQFMD